MSVEVLLMTDVPHLGSEGDVVAVADGYARNYLLPKKMAAPVTEATRRQLAKMRERRRLKQDARLKEARRRAETLSNVSCTLAVKVAEGDKLYGSVAAADIAAALAEQGVEVDKKTIVLEQPIRELGVFDIQVALHPDVNATLKLWVVEE